MRILTALAALLLLACPMAAKAAVPTASCPDILVGDSLAVGMGPYARAAGFQVIARTGIGLNWLRAQDPRCARRVVVVIGTNDLRGIDPWSAEAYPARLAAIMARWQTQEITWATPGCFPHDLSLERGSEALDRALAREPLVRVGGQREYMRVHSGRVARCSYLSGDGIHPTGTGYRAWWASLSQAIGAAPEGEIYREARATPEAYTSHAARHARSDRYARSARQARSARPTAQQVRSARQVPSVRPDRLGRSTQLARLDRRGSAIHAARPDRAARTLQASRQAPVQQARAERNGRPIRQTRPIPEVRQARVERNARPVQQARTLQPARATSQARPPVPARMVAVNPTRRT